ncbi:hypothetical protein AAG570_000701 [Ranatra chinensis]|uniref:Uncharacterized protein n=1 Tax=Ranatra chinensis TaxID=642074 RepID=A0ABD0YXU4_9HEMI
MGVNWLTELASWLLGGPDHIWYFTDVTNTLQGVFIFVILVCKRRTWTLLRVRCREMGLCFTGGKPPRSPMNGTTVKTNTTSIEWSTPPQATRTRKPNRDDRDEVIPLDPILS